MAVVLWGLVAFALQLYIVFARPVGVPSNPPDGRPLALPRDAGDARLSQTFTVDADGFSEVTLYPARPAPDSGTLTGQVQLSLWDITDTERPVSMQQVTIDARELTAHDRQTLRVPPVSHSRGHRYRLDAFITGTGGHAHVALLSVADNVYRDGALTVNDRAEWGDLAFDVRAAEDTPFRQFVAHASVASWLPQASAFWIALIAAYTAVASGVLFRIAARAA